MFFSSWSADSDNCYRALEHAQRALRRPLFSLVSARRGSLPAVSRRALPATQNCRFFRVRRQRRSRGIRPCLRCGGARAGTCEHRRGSTPFAGGRAVDRGWRARAGRRRTGPVDHPAPASAAEFEAEFGVSPIGSPRRSDCCWRNPARRTRRCRSSTSRSKRLCERAPVQRAQCAPSPDSTVGFAAMPRHVAAIGAPLELAYRPPYDWPSMLAGSCARAGVERIEADSYQRDVGARAQRP